MLSRSLEGQNLAYTFLDFLLTEPVVTGISVRPVDPHFAASVDLVCSYGSASLGGYIIA